MKKYFAVLTLIFCILSKVSIAQDSTATTISNNQKNSRFEEKLRQNKEKRQKRLDEIQQRSQKRREENKEKREERRSDRQEERRVERKERREERRVDQRVNEDQRESSRMENRVAKMPEINQNQTETRSSQPREMGNGNRR